MAHLLFSNLARHARTLWVKTDLFFVLLPFCLGGQPIGILYHPLMSEEYRMVHKLSVEQLSSNQIFGSHQYPSCCELLLGSAPRQGLFGV